MFDFIKNYRKCQWNFGFFRKNANKMSEMDTMRTFFDAFMKNLSKRQTFFPQSIDKTGGAIIDMSNGQFYPLPDIVRKFNKMPSRAKLDAILQERTKCQRHGVRRLFYNRAVITGGAAAPRAKAASAGDRMGTRHLPRGAAYACRCAHMGYRRETV